MLPSNEFRINLLLRILLLHIFTYFPVSSSSSVQFINETIRDALATHERVALVYQHRRVSRDTKQINSRKDDVLLSFLRSGHHPSLRQYLNRLDPSQDSICPNCRLEVQDLLHWLCECPALMTIRQRVFGKDHGSFEWQWLATRPVDVVAYARKTLVNLDARPINIRMVNP